jgi:hypothetical protein
VGPDQTIVTGWGEADEYAVSRYHNRFARFRGYAFFESDDASKLPWTTTKTGVDSNADLYQATRQRMIEVMQPILEFLRAVEREREDPPEGILPLEEVIALAAPTSLANAQSAERFRPVRRQIRRTRPKDQSIQYRRPIAQIEQAKEVLGVTSAAAVGEESFDYFFERECNGVR